MRIGLDVHVLSGRAQGTATIWRNVLPSLPVRHTYILYSFDPDWTRAEYPAGHFEHRRIPIHQPHARIALAYPWLAHRDRCDVFHVNYFGPAVGVRSLVASFPDVLYLDFPELATPVRRLQFRVLGRLTSSGAKHLITGSEYAKRRIMHHFAVRDDRVSVIYDPLDQSWHTPDDDALDRAWMQVRDRVPARYLLGVGRLEPRKNVALTARVARTLRAEGLTDGLVWVGPDDFGTPAIERALDREGLRGVVTRLQGLSTAELQAIYRHAQTLVFLSLAEGFGYPAIEAMAMRTPTVSSNRTAMPEVLGDAALLVDPDDVGATTAAVRATLTDAACRERLIGTGLQRITRYHPREAADQIAAVYERVADYADAFPATSPRSTNSR